MRLVFPVGTKDEPAVGIATRAATDLQVNDGYGAGPDAIKRIAWYANAVEHTDVDVTETSTHFRAVGFAALGDWHVFAVARHVIRGSYELAPLAPFHRHYVPTGATLIVSGGFDIAAVKPSIERWYSPWPLPTLPAPAAMAVARGPKRPITYEPAATDSVELELAYGAADHTNGGAAQLLASAIELRLARVTRASAQITVTFDPRDSRLVVLAELRSATADQVTDAARELIDPATLQVTLRSPKASTSNVLRAIGFGSSAADRR